MSISQLWYLLWFYYRPTLLYNERLRTKDGQKIFSAEFFSRCCPAKTAEPIKLKMSHTAYKWLRLRLYQILSIIGPSFFGWTASKQKISAEKDFVRLFSQTFFVQFFLPNFFLSHFWYSVSRVLLFFSVRHLYRYILRIDSFAIANIELKKNS